MATTNFNDYSYSTENYYNNLRGSDFLYLGEKLDNLLKSLAKRFYNGTIIGDNRGYLPSGAFVERTNNGFQQHMGNHPGEISNFTITSGTTPDFNKIHPSAPVITNNVEKYTYGGKAIQTLYQSGFIYENRMAFNMTKAAYMNSTTVSGLLPRSQMNINNVAKAYRKAVHAEFMSGLYKSVGVDSYDANGAPLPFDYKAYSLTPVPTDGSTTGLTNELLSIIASGIQSSSHGTEDLSKWYIIVRRSEWVKYAESIDDKGGNSMKTMMMNLGYDTDPIFQLPIFNINVIVVENGSVAANNMQYDGANPICPVFSSEGYGFCSFIPSSIKGEMKLREMAGNYPQHGEVLTTMIDLDGVFPMHMSLGVTPFGEEYAIKEYYASGLLSTKVDSTKFAFVKLKSAV